MKTIKRNLAQFNPLKSFVDKWCSWEFCFGPIHSLCKPSENVSNVAE